MGLDRARRLSEPHPANLRLAGAFAEVAALLRLQRTDRYRVRAYRDAGRLLAALPVDVATLTTEQLRRLRGVGPAIARAIEEHLATGALRYLDRLREDQPAGLGILIQVQGVTPRIARELALQGVRDLPGLARLSHRGELEDVPGVAASTAGVIAEGLRRFDLAAPARLILRQARQQAAELAAALAEAVPGTSLHVAGEVRRGVPQPAGLDLLAVTAEPASVRSAALELAVVPLPAEDPDTVALLTDRGRPATVRFAAADAAGTALVVATGAAPHVAWLRERGLPPAAPDEAAAYAACGLEVVPPPRRERPEAAGPVVELRDLRGDLHVHSRWSRDGHDDLDVLADAAAARGHAYLALTDHAEDLRIVGMSRALLAERDAAIAAHRSAGHAVVLLRGLELNIGPQGGLDYDPETRAAMDVNVASIHSLFRLPVARQTDRLLAAIADPTVDVIGHPTGRLLGHRDGYDIELEAVAQAAAETGTALEVNGSPRRLDLDAALIEIALHHGARLAVSSDAHVSQELDYTVESVLTAQRGGATREQVVNTLDLRALRAWVAGHRRS